LLSRCRPTVKYSEFFEKITRKWVFIPFHHFLIFIREISDQAMRGKKIYIIILFIMIFPFVCEAQLGNWSPWVTVFQDDAHPYPHVVQVSFKLATHCLSYSYYRTNSTFNIQYGTVSFNYDYIDCDGKIQTERLTVNLDKPGVDFSQTGSWFIGSKVETQFRDVAFYEPAQRTNNPSSQLTSTNYSQSNNSSSSYSTGTYKPNNRPDQIVLKQQQNVNKYTPPNINIGGISNQSAKSQLAEAVDSVTHIIANLSQKEKQGVQSNTIENIPTASRVTSYTHISKSSPVYGRTETYINPLINSKAPDIQFTQPNGKTFKLSDYSGKKILLVFWASYNDASIEQFNIIKANYQQLLAKGVEVIGIAQEYSSYQWQTAIKDNELPGLQVSELNGTVNDTYPYYHIEQLPSIFYINISGIVVAERDNFNQVKTLIQ
jgi:peroxiredoxin